MLTPLSEEELAELTNAAQEKFDPENYDLEDIDPREIDRGKRFREERDLPSDFLNSIRAKGIITPITVLRKAEGVDPNQPFLLMAGGRRHKASLIIEMDRIPAKIYNAANGVDYRQIELWENIHREDLSGEEELALTAEIDKTWKAIYGEKTRREADAPGHSTVDTAKMLGKSDTQVREEIETYEAMQRFPEVFKGVKGKTNLIKTKRELKRAIATQELSRRAAVKMEAESSQDRKNVLDSYVIGDFLEVSKTLPNGIFHIAEIDPPYGIDLNKSDKHNATDYEEIPQKDYPDFMDRVLGRTSELLRDDAWILLWYAKFWEQTLLDLLRKHGFRPDIIPAIWYKVASPSPSPRADEMLGRGYEQFLYARRGRAGFNKGGAANIFPRAGVSPGKRFHPAERPIGLIEDILRVFAASHHQVLCPFAGSGKTLLAARNLGMKALGFDIDPQYKPHFTMMVNEQKAGEYRD